jgi:AraC-like DNA-binding protein
MQSFEPTFVLRDRVLAIDVVEHEGGEICVLPSTSAVLGLQVCGRVRSRDALLSIVGVTGIQSEARRYVYVGPTVSLLVRFTPQGASCLGVPVSELADRSVALAELLGPARAREASERLHDAPDTVARVQVVEQLLLGLAWVPDAIVERALELLRVGSNVAAVARELAISERQLERRFLARIGLTPKRFASLRRFEHALAHARTSPSLTDTALAAGYYDQSHFIRDFHRFAGATPGELLGMSDSYNRRR